MLAGLPAVATGSAFVMYWIGKQFDPKIELKILSMFTGTQKIIAQIVKNFGGPIKSYAAQYNVPWQYVVGIVFNETKGIPYPVKDSLHPEKWVTIEPGHKKYYPLGSDYHLYSSYGPMQVSWTTAGKNNRWVSDWRQLIFSPGTNTYNFDKNIECGIKLMSVNYAAYKNWDNAVMAYNGTPGTETTLKYLKNVSDAVYTLNDMIKKGEVYA